MERIEKAIEILQAFKEGKRVEVFMDATCDWYGVVNADIIFDRLKNKPDSIRIAKEPEYSPYANAEEFLKDSKEHGPYLICKCFKSIYELPCIIHNDRVYWTRDEEKWDGMSSLLDNYTWQDGTTCGKIITV